MAKSVEEVKEKLRKLYAMMDTEKGACQSEVESAMKAARKLMAEYKLSEKDFIEKDLKVISVLVDIKYSSIVNPWIHDLNKVVAENYCCHGTMYNIGYSKQKYIGLMGFEDDVELAEKVIKYAVNCILKDGEDIRKRMLKNGYTHKEITSAINAYGNGYTRGIYEAFIEQNKTEDDTFAMVMLTPQDVMDAASKLKKRNFDSTEATKKARAFDRLAYAGYREGKKFNISEKLTG